MNRNNYSLGIKDVVLQKKVDYLMDNIVFLSNERVYNKHFPSFATIEFTDVDEDELVQHIEELETIYTKLRNEDVHGLLHHKAYLYILDEDMKIYHNDLEYGVGIITSAPVTGGKNPKEALKNAWEKWSIPPVLIMNSNYYCPGITIGDVIE